LALPAARAVRYIFCSQTHKRMPLPSLTQPLKAWTFDTKAKALVKTKARAKKTILKIQNHHSS
jgi:hypothetical protein